MEGLQDELGALNDLVCTPAVLEQLGIADHPKAKTLVPDEAKSDLVKRALAALDEVSDTKQVWR